MGISQPADDFLACFTRIPRVLNDRYRSNNQLRLSQFSCVPGSAPHASVLLLKHCGHLFICDICLFSLNSQIGPDGDNDA